MQQPGNFTDPPQPPRRNIWRWYRARNPFLQIGLGCLSLVVLLFAGVFCAASIAVATGHGVQVAPTPATVAQATATPTSQPTQARPTVTVVPTPTPAPTKALTPTPTPSHYPPQNKADLMALAALGDASAIHEFHSESVGLTGACPQPKRLVTVDPKITGKQLAEDLLAYFYQNGLDNPCGSVVFAFHTQAESNADNGYTVGRVLLDTANQDGSANYDPNATGLKYTLTLDTGDALTAQDEIVTYNQ